MGIWCGLWLLPSWGALPPDVEIARFLGDRPAAYSLTFDDGLVTHVTESIPILDRHGLHGTFFVFTENIKEDTPSNWAAWRRVAATGHEVGSHSRTHLDLTLPVAREVLEDEIAGSYRMIKDKVGIAPVSFAYPYSSENDYVKRLVLETYAFDRSDCRVWGGDEFSVETGMANIDRAIAEGVWEYVMLHGVGEYTWGTLAPEVLDALCGYLVRHRDRIWTDTYARVSSYIRKRNAAEVIRRNVAAASFEFRLRLPDRPEFQNLADVPLTVRIPLEGRDAASIRGVLGGAEPLALRTSDDGRFLLADVPTDGRWVKILW